MIRQFLPADRPSLILVDELLNYVSRNRKSGLSGQLYSFVQNLAEEARAVLTPHPGEMSRMAGRALRFALGKPVNQRLTVP